MVKIPSILNPYFIVSKGDRIIPNLRYYAGYSIWVIQRCMARFGWPVSANEKALAELKDKHQGERCFIIGNGPSLSIKDLDRLKDEITFASNKIYLAFDQTEWRPTYYAVEDSLVAKQNYDVINQLEGFTKLFPVRMKLWVPELRNAIYFKLKFYHFYPNKTYKPSFGINALKKLYCGATIIYTCIQLACFMGIREIYLIGMDFEFSTPTVTDERDRRILISTGEVNHFHPDYRKPGEKWHEPNLHHQEKSFLEAREAVQRMGGNIYNVTRGGRLEIFPRVDFDEVIGSGI